MGFKFWKSAYSDNISHPLIAQQHHSWCVFLRCLQVPSTGLDCPGAHSQHTSKNWCHSPLKSPPSTLRLHYCKIKAPKTRKENSLSATQQQNGYFVLTAKPSSLPPFPPAGFCLQIRRHSSHKQLSAGNNAIYQVWTHTAMTEVRLALPAGMLNSMYWYGLRRGQFICFPHYPRTQRPSRGFSTYLPRTAVGRAGRGCCTGGGRALQSHQGHGRWAAALEGSRGGEEKGGGGMWEDAPLRLSLSPGRKCLVRLSSSSTWLQSPAGAPSRSWSVRPLRLPESSWAGSHERFPPCAAQKRQQSPIFYHRCADRQTKHGAGCKRGRNDMQLCRMPVIGWPSSRARCHWANVVKVTGQTRNSQIQMLME